MSVCGPLFCLGVLFAVLFIVCCLYLWYNKWLTLFCFWILVGLLCLEVVLVFWGIAVIYSWINVEKDVYVCKERVEFTLAQRAKNTKKQRLEFIFLFFC